MEFIDTEDIKGSRNSDTGEVLCAKCMPKVRTFKDAKAIITKEFMESHDQDIYFCCVCEKKL